MKDVTHCSGCHDDFYNHGGGCTPGPCWSLKSARVVSRKRVHINQRPPWDQKAERLPNCYHAPQYVFVEPHRTR